MAWLLVVDKGIKTTVTSTVGVSGSPLKVSRVWKQTIESHTRERQDRLGGLGGMRLLAGFA